MILCEIYRDFDLGSPCLKTVDEWKSNARGHRDVDVEGSAARLCVGVVIVLLKRPLLGVSDCLDPR